MSTLAVTPDDALSVLEHWQAGDELFGFAYRRSGGLVTQRGHARILQATPDAFALETFGGRLDVMVRGATFEFGARALFMREPPGTPDSEGLFILLENEDRMFLYPRGSASR